MSQDNTQTTPASQVDFMVIDTLFRRIAERGRKVRTQGQNTPQADSTTPDPKEVKHETNQTK